MAYKVYKTGSLRYYSLDITVDFRRITIDFTSGFQIGSTATYGTSNPKIQKALESLKAFGRDFYIYEETPDAAPAEAPVVKVEEKKEEKVLPKEFIDSKSFRNLVEMKEALKAAGLKISEGWNYAQTKKFAFENGYDYKISKAEN